MKRLPLEIVKNGRRVCAYCGEDIAPERPQYLVRQDDGSLVGPFHPACSERLKLRAKHLKPGEKLPGQPFGKVWDSLAQEEIEL